MPADTQEFQLGRLFGQMDAQTAQLTDIQTRLVGMDARLRVAENNTTKLTVQMGLVGLASGGAGSAILQIAIHFLFK